MDILNETRFLVKGLSRNTKQHGVVFPDNKKLSSILKEMYGMG